MTERTNEFINDLNDKFSKNIKLVEYQFNTEYNWPEFDPLRDEISKCLICDLCQAAITLTNHLLENFLKTILIYQDMISIRENNNDRDSLNFRPSLDKFDQLDLGQSLRYAKSKKLITKEQWKMLDRFREDFRNAYSHAEKKKIFKDIAINTNQVQIDNGKMKISESKQTSLIDFPIGQGIGQAILSKTIAFEYFTSVDNIIRDVLNKFMSYPNHTENMDS